MEMVRRGLQIDLTPPAWPQTPGPRGAHASGSRNGARILIYSHDTFGLGHLRRCLLIAGRLSEHPDVSSILIATGSPLAQSFRLPPRCDSVKLPAITKSEDGRYRPRSLSVSTERVFDIRASVLESVARSFSPDLILVDHAPAGAQGELWPLLRWVETLAHPPALVLGLRDVIDDVARVGEEWDRLAAWSALEGLYDRILVYGDPAVLTTAEELGLADRHGDRIRFVGYLARSPRVIDTAPQDPPTIVVTAGGGGDGVVLLRTYADFLAGLPAPASFRSLLITGPFFPARSRLEIGRQCATMNHPVETVDFVAGLEEILAGAAGAVTMGGYNTVTELLATGTPALVVPRETPRREQSLRAERLGRVTQLEYCKPEDYGRGRLAHFVHRVLGGRPATPVSLRIDGLDQTVREIGEVLSGRPGTLNGGRLAKLS